MIKRSGDGYEAECDMCGHKLKGDTWQEVKDMTIDFGWKQEFDTGLWVNLCPDCWEF